ncbi:MAG: helix-turn-helix domain-containing protein [Candidatus Marsarchaeota archaeon]|nr:helix-turn-helix domain-containing protein [Candidatus Marsarchaeota archaeon]
MEDAILTATEVARYLKLSKSRIYYLNQRQKMPHSKIGRNVRVRRSSLTTWLERKSLGPRQVS